MFQLFHDTKRNVVFILKQKCGSSALGMIVREQKLYKEIITVSFNDIILLVSNDPEIEIVMTLRDPEAAYLSGMNQVLKDDKLIGLDYKKSATAHVTAYSKKLKPFVKNWENELPRYDFLDSHCYHGLWLMLLLLAGDRNVTIIKMPEWTEYLIKHYPKNKKHWKFLHSDMSMCGPSTHGQVTEKSLTSFAAFNNIVINPQRNSNSPYTWEKWMAIEHANFNSIMAYLEDGESRHLKYALNKLAAADIYWGSHTDCWKQAATLELGINLSGKPNLPDSILLLNRQQMESKNIF